MATYFKHMEDDPGGKDGACLDYAQSRLGEIEEAIESLVDEQRFWAHVISKFDSVCKVCGGTGTHGYLPPGASRGQGLYRHVPCSGCRKAEYKLATK